MVLVVTSGGAGRRDKQIGHAIARASVALAESCPASPTAPLKRALSAIMDRAAGSIPRPKPVIDAARRGVVGWFVIAPRLLSYPRLS